ncbi:hypothetical protein Vretifemale_4908 [Volvox reticuliferus]|nr:hypothetical protein Vretifemale_4908 [Volvox reticuliferus]
MLYDTVCQELEERGVSHKVFQQLAPTVHLQPEASLGAGLGLGSLGPFTAPFPTAVVVKQPIQPVAALYSFGSFGASGASGGSAMPTAPLPPTTAVAGGSTAPASTVLAYGYGSSQHHAYLTHQQGSQPATGGMAQAVNAMVAATVRHNQPPALVNGPAAGVPAVPRAQLATLPPSGLLSAPVLTPAPAAASSGTTSTHTLLRNYDLSPPAATPKPLAQQPLTAVLQRLPPPVLTLQPQFQSQLQTTTTPQTALQIQIQAHSPGPTPTGDVMLTPSDLGSPRNKASSSSGDGGGGVDKKTNGRACGGGAANSSGAGSESEGDGLATPADAPAGGKAFGPGGEASTASVASNGGGEGGGAANGRGGGKQLTPWEAAMLAFQEEQRLLRKARKAIRKGPPPKAGAKKPGSVSPSQASNHHHHQHSPLGAESSSCSTRPGAKPPRPSGTGNTATATTPGPGKASAAAPSSPHGAAALAAGAAAATRGTAASTAANGAGGEGPKGGKSGAAASGVGNVARSQVGGNGSKTSGAGSAAASASPAAAAPAAALGAHAVRTAGEATATATTAVACPAAAAAEPPQVDLDAVPEEQGLAARTQAVSAEAAAVQLREPSEPESVKTDEESNEMVAAAMREASAAAAAADAARKSGKGGKGSVSDSDPESVSSGSQQSEQEEHGHGQLPEQLRERKEEHSESGLSGADLRVQGYVLSAPAGPERPDAAVLPANVTPPPRAMSASHASPWRQQQPSRPGQPVLVATIVKAPPTAAASVVMPRSAWGAAPPPQQPMPSRGPEADTVPSESDSGADSDVGSASDFPESPVKRTRMGPGHQVLSNGKLQQRGVEDEEEARQRAIAAAAAAAIQGRSAADASMFVGSANQLARAVISDGPMKVDRWSDWDLADSSDALSAWATNHDGDPVRGGHLRATRPVGHLAPPESLVTGPAGAHALPQMDKRSIGLEGSIGGGSIGGSRQGVRFGEGVAVPRAGSAPHSSSGRRVAAAAEPVLPSSASALAVASGGGGDSSSSDDDGDAAGDAGESGLMRRGERQQQLPRAGVVPAGTKAATLPNASTAPGSSAAAVRRPPVPPGSSAPSHSTGRSGPSSSNGGAPSLPRGGGGSSGNLAFAATAATGAAAAASASSDAATAAASYLQYYGSFHDILTLCYSSLPVMLDAAALASSSVAAVAGAAGGGGGGGSRPPSRMLLGSVAASGIDVMERYAGLLARCEAWQAKLRHLTSAMPTEDPPSVAAVTATASTPSSDVTAAEQQQQQSLPMPTPQTRRYVAVIDDTAHPEVRNVVVAALRLLSPSWALDPADQVTEQAKPEASADDDAGGAGGSNGNSRPPTAAPGGAGGPRAGTAVGAAGIGLGGGVSGPGSGQPLISGGAVGSGGVGSSGGASSNISGSPGGSGGTRCHMWNVLWSWSVKVRVPVNDLMVWQRVNHFAEARQLTRKDLLKKHLAKYQVMHNTGRSAALFDRLTPTTFVLPKEAAAFEEAFVRALHGVEPTCVQPVGLNLWIQKPVGLSRGRGISLISSLKKVNMAEAMVVQRYLTDPLLVEGYKFDLRLYVLVTSFNPLEAWIYDEGFARFTTLPYTLDEAELGNMYVHLTNSSVQRTRAEAGQLPAFLQAAEPAGGSKTSLATLRRLLSRHGVDWPLLWSRVCEVATAALFAAQDAIPHSPNSFELFGFDMMIDAELKVWLLEVNSSPSMGLDTPLDRAIKPRLIADVLELLAPLPFDRTVLSNVLRTRTNTSRSGRRGTQGLLSGTASEERELCCADLQAVLGGALPRRYGEKPRSTGGFTACLAPSPFHDRLLKLRRPLP